MVPRTALIALAALSALMGVAAAQPQTSNLQRLHDALRLGPGQQQAWTEFAAQASPDPEAAAQARAAQTMMPTLHAPQRVDLSIAALRAQLGSMERRGAALKAFYATLTPDQQATFDRETLPSGREP